MVARQSHTPRPRRLATDGGPSGGRAAAWAGGRVRGVRCPCARLLMAVGGPAHEACGPSPVKVTKVLIYNHR